MNPRPNETEGWEAIIRQYRLNQSVREQPPLSWLEEDEPETQTDSQNNSEQEQNN